jgi:diacylglycerol kinase
MHWLKKFSNAARGILAGILGQSSFAMHLPVALLVIIAAAWFQVTTTEWLVLLLTIALVLTAELINSAVESLAQAITQEHHPQIGRALDIAAGAVLVASLFAIVTGLLIFWPYVKNVMFTFTQSS